MYSVIDLRLNPPQVVSGTENFTEQQCIDWISQNGDATIYSIKKIS